MQSLTADASILEFSATVLSSVCHQQKKAEELLSRFCFAVRQGCGLGLDVSVSRCTNVSSWEADASV